MRDLGGISGEEKYQVSIIGVRNVVDKEIPIYRKLLWIISLLSCCCLVAYYVSNRVLYAMSLPTQVAVILKQNESIQLPVVILCPNTPFVPEKLKLMGMTADGLPSTNFTYNGIFNVTALWQDLSISSNFIRDSSVSSDSENSHWKEIFTTMGRCFRHTYDGEIQASGLSFGMSIRIDWQEIYHSKALSDREGMKVFFVERNDIPLTEVEGINIAPREDVSIAIRIKEFKSLNRKEHPCIVEEDYSRSRCVNHCFNEELHQLTQCKLPFMREITGEWCEPEKLYQGAFRTFWRRAKSNVSLWAKCGQICLIKCQKLIYTPFIESVAFSDENVGELIIYFPEMWYEIVEQKDSYDVIAFLCDVGGTFGLFLGCSVLTLVEIIEIFALFMTRRKTVVSRVTSASKTENY